MCINVEEILPHPFMCIDIEDILPYPFMCILCALRDTTIPIYVHWYIEEILPYPFMYIDI